MDLAGLKELQTPTGLEALRAAAQCTPTIATLLQCIGRLSKRFPPALARAALETVMLRHKAQAKFAAAESMFFTREALEQASGEFVSSHRARRFEPFGVVGDYCCGIGGDTLALARRGPVTSVDLDPLRLEMARLNLQANGIADRVTLLHGDLTTMQLPEVSAAFFDPDRRADGERHVSLRRYRPNLDALLDRLPVGFPLGVKLAPAVSWGELSRYHAEAEFLSVHGELKECVLWFGPLRSCARRATVLPGGQSLAADEVAPAPSPGPPKRYLYDLDPAILRAGLVTNLACELGAHQIDPETAYLTSDEARPTAFATLYRVEEALPFHLVNLKERLRALRVGELTIVRRASAVDPMKLLRQLKPVGPLRRVLILTRVLNQPYALIAERVENPAS